MTSLPSIGALGGLTGDKYNPTGWIEPITAAAIEICQPYSDEAYAIDGLRMHLDRRAFEELYDALIAEGIGIVTPGRGVLVEGCPDPAAD